MTAVHAPPTPGARGAAEGGEVPREPAGWRTRVRRRHLAS